MIGLLKNAVFTMLISLLIAETTAAIQPYNDLGDGNSIVIKFEAIQSEIAYVKLMDKDGVRLWSDVIKGQEKFVKQFNLYQLPDGDYKVVLNDGNVNYIQRIRKTAKSIFVVDNALDKVVTPATKMYNKQFVVKYTEGIEEMISISFQGSNGDVFFVDAIDEYKKGFKKVYNLKQLPAGDFTAIIKTDKHAYYVNLNI